MNEAGRSPDNRAVSQVTVSQRYRIAALCRELTAASHLRSKREGGRIPGGRNTSKAWNRSSGCGWGWWHLWLEHRAYAGGHQAKPLNRNLGRHGGKHCLEGAESLRLLNRTEAYSQSCSMTVSQGASCQPLTAWASYSHSFLTAKPPFKIKNETNKPKKPCPWTESLSNNFLLNNQAHENRPESLCRNPLLFCVFLFLNGGLSWWLGGSQVALVLKNLTANAGDVRDVGSILGSGRSLGGGHGNPLQYSCLENPKDTEAWQATVHRVAKSWTRLKWLSMHTLWLVDVYLSHKRLSQNPRQWKPGVLTTGPPGGSHSHFYYSYISIDYLCVCG